MDDSSASKHLNDLAGRLDALEVVVKLLLRLTVSDAARDLIADAVDVALSQHGAPQHLRHEAFYAALEGLVVDVRDSDHADDGT